MRVNPDTQSGLLAALDRVNASQQKVLNQLSSGLRIQTPADDPAGAAALVEVQSNDAATQQFLSTANSLQTQLTAADSALNSVGTALTRALSLGVEGANGTLSDSDRSAVANELTGIKNELLELSNSSVQGTYLFSGTSVKTQPFVADGSATGISYQGNDTSNQIEIGENYYIPGNVAGSSVFGDGTTGVFKAISDLITAVQSGTGADTATTEITDAINQVSTARVQYGNALNQITSGQAILNTDHIQLQQQINNLSATDVAAAASGLATTETSRNALLDVIAKTNGTSLFDYIQ
jgi:flagellar hook-associated protein 3 FlgL